MNKCIFLFFSIQHPLFVLTYLNIVICCPYMFFQKMIQKLKMAILFHVRHICVMMYTMRVHMLIIWSLFSFTMHRVGVCVCVSVCAWVSVNVCFGCVKMCAWACVGVCLCVPSTPELGTFGIF